jgi:hypothetical protein
MLNPEFRVERHQEGSGKSYVTVRRLSAGVFPKGAVGI